MVSPPVPREIHQGNAGVEGGIHLHAQGSFSVPGGGAVHREPGVPVPAACLEGGFEVAKNGKLDPRDSLVAQRRREREAGDEEKGSGNRSRRPPHPFGKDLRRGGEPGQGDHSAHHVPEKIPDRGVPAQQGLDSLRRGSRDEAEGEGDPPLTRRRGFPQRPPGEQQVTPKGEGDDVAQIPGGAQRPGGSISGSARKKENREENRRGP